MKVLLDACVLYPPVLRGVLLGVARQGLFEPLWSARLLEEWARAAARRGAACEMEARGEIALLRAGWPGAEVAPRPGLEERLYLPDPGDLHVLAAAIAGSADILLTHNARDFPRGTLALEGVSRADPDAFLLGLWKATPAPIADAVGEVATEAARREGAPVDLRRLMKRARLPRLGKALAG